MGHFGVPLTRDHVDDVMAEQQGKARATARPCPYSTSPPGGAPYLPTTIGWSLGLRCGMMPSPPAGAGLVKSQLVGSMAAE